MLDSLNLIIDVPTERRCQMVDVTGEVRRAVSEAGVECGLAIVYVPHTTAGVTINENADPDVPHDILLTLEALVPHHRPGYRHAEGNSDSHVKASIVGSSQIVLIENGRLVLGTWQGIFFMEFDGPRRRKMHVRVVDHG